MLLAAGACRAWPLQSAGEIPFTVDAAAFADADGRTWQQFYWSCAAGAFAPQDTLGQRRSQFRTAVQLRDSAGALVVNEGWNSVAGYPSAVELKKRSLVRLDQLDCRGLRPGRYQLLFTITDLVSRRSGAVEADVAVPAIDSGRPGISQIELASDVRPDTTGQRFRKGGLRVVPNPSHLFTESAPNAYYYLELYGLQHPAGLRLKISYSADNDSASGTVVDEDLTGSASQDIRVGGIKLDELPAGGYRLWAQLADAQSRPLATATTAFAIKRDPLALMPGSEKMVAEQAAMEEAGGKFYDQIQYIASARQLETYGKLDSLGRREFLRHFWKARDTDPKTSVNEALAEHARRCAYANDRFSEQIGKGLGGIQTDRGRIYIKNGEPETIDAKPLEMDYKPVLIWRYEGNKKAIFVDLTGVGRYQLVWSNITGEHNNPRYFKLLSPVLMDAESIEY